MTRRPYPVPLVTEANEPSEAVLVEAGRLWVKLDREAEEREAAQATTPPAPQPERRAA